MVTEFLSQWHSTWAWRGSKSQPQIPQPTALPLLADVFSTSLSGGAEKLPGGECVPAQPGRLLPVVISSYSKAKWESKSILPSSSSLVSGHFRPAGLLLLLRSMQHQHCPPGPVPVVGAQRGLQQVYRKMKQSSAADTAFTQKLGKLGSPKGVFPTELLIQLSLIPDPQGKFEKYLQRMNLEMKIRNSAEYWKSWTQWLALWHTLIFLWPWVIHLWCAYNSYTLPISVILITSSQLCFSVKISFWFSKT